MATPIKWGNEFLVNTITARDQADPAITGLADGRFVAMWTNYSAALGDNDKAVHGQIFNADGSKAGVEFLVNTTTAFNQVLPAVTALKNGGFVATWEQEAFATDIYAQVFGPDGSKLGPEIFVKPVNDGQYSPDIAPLVNAVDGADAGFVITWGEFTNGIGHDVRAQRYDANGNKVGNDFLVNTATALNQWQPVVAGLTNGRFVVAWESESGGADPVRLQIFNADGSKFGAEFGATPFVIANQLDPSITALAGGRFIVTWTNELNGEFNSYGQIFNADGTREPGLVLDSSANGTYLTDITALPDGRFVATWTEENNSADDYRVVGQLFNADATKSGSEFIVPTSMAGHQLDSHVAALADGRFAVIWQDQQTQLIGPGGDGSDSGVRAQIFDPRESGTPLTGAALNDDLVGTAFNDTLKGAGGDDILRGMGGDDLLAGGAGADQLFGGDGSDTASYLPSSTGVTVDLATSFNSGDGAAGDIFDSIENVVGSDHDDIIFGNAADNVIEGGAGGDSMVGGDGIDTVSYRNSDAGVKVSLVSGLGFGGHAQGDSVSNTFENMVGSGFGDTLVGYSTANVIEGGLGSDTIDGKGGDDTAVFSHNFNDYTVADFGSFISVYGPDGWDALTSIEHLRFADVTITPAQLANDGNPLFDTLYYLSRNPDVFHAGVNALDHFNAFGRHEGRDPNAFFDTSEYLSVYRDAAASGMNPLEHYHQIGWQQGHDPAANFDTKLYLIHNPDVAATGVDPLLHYLQSGAAEGRQAYQAIGDKITGGFDAEFYLRHNPDVAAAGVDPLLHFNTFGCHEGRNPNAWFDTAGYLAHYADVAAAGANPLEHYKVFGWQEGRDPSAGFDTAGYLAANPDVAAAHVNPLDHYLQFGIYEGRQAVSDGVWH